MKNFIFLFGFAFFALVSFTAFAQEEPQQQIQTDEQPFTEAELAQMLAPIALYPDSLLTHILIASTYPIEIVEAHRWLKKNEELNAEQAAQSVKDFDWDASVKALVPFERILSRLSEDLGWTQQLGDAFLQDEARLLENIQVLRKQAKVAGNLDKMDNMEVSYEDNNIIIEPREKEIVYVPYYDTRMVYGDWHWSSYPPVYWTPYHSVYLSHYSPFYWHSGIHISFNYFFSAFHWHNRHVVVVNSHRSHYYRGRSQISTGGYAKRWVHQPKHRKGVAYRTKHTSQKYRSNRANVHKAREQRFLAKHNKTQPHVKQHSSVKHSMTNKRDMTKAQTRNKSNNRPVAKQHTPRVNTKDLRAKKIDRANTSVKKDRMKSVVSKPAAPKAYTKNSSRHNVKQGSSKVTKRHNTQRKSSQRSQERKSYHAKASKARHN
jgi:hypothetical protein